MSEFSNLVDEFRVLKQELFGEDLFVVLDDNNPKVKRYYQLLGFFFPQFKTSDWISPIDGTHDCGIRPVPWGT